MGGRGHRVFEGPVRLRGRGAVPWDCRVWAWSRQRQVGARPQTASVPGIRGHDPESPSVAILICIASREVLLPLGPWSLDCPKDPQIPPAPCV